MKDQMLDANFPKDAQGRTYHVGTSQGQVANRIITVGEHQRARRVARHFDQSKPIFEHESHRNFLTITGEYQGVQISIVSIGMGITAVDFFIRECRAVIKGNMFVIRLGSCGAIGWQGARPEDSVDVGSVVIPYKSVGIFRNYDAFNNILDQNHDSYIITQPLPCSQRLHKALVDEFTNPDLKITSNKKNASTDSFYSSQGRLSEVFEDRNEDLIARLQTLHPDLETFEMETYQLNHLMKCSNLKGKENFETASVQIVFANRGTKEFIKPELVESLEKTCGLSILKVLTNFK